MILSQFLSYMQYICMPSASPYHIAACLFFHLVLKSCRNLISKVILTMPLLSTVKHYISCTQDHNRLILWISMSCHAVHSLNPIFCNNAPLKGSSHELKQKCFGHTPDYLWPSSNAECNYYAISLCALERAWPTCSQENRNYFNDNSRVMRDMIWYAWTGLMVNLLQKI